MIYLRGIKLRCLQPVVSLLLRQCKTIQIIQRVLLQFGMDARLYQITVKFDQMII